ncbi:MAG: FtsX-like permease family protein [Bacteroidetes bacterium]|nr:FtsX-like permease family protein [Bacteroidota bacterium]
MSKSVFFAIRYLVSKKTHNAVNYISWISVLGFFGGSLAMIVILSTLNGFESLILSMYSHFDPDFKIESAEGKIFSIDSTQMKLLNKTPGLESLNMVLEDQAVIKHYDYQAAVYIKGVNDDYFFQTNLDKYVQDGSAELKVNNMNLAILGAGVDFKLQTRVNNPQSIATIYTPRRENVSITDPNQLQSLLIKPSGVVYLDDQINQKYVFVPLSFAKELFERDDEISYIELRIKPEKISEAEQYLEKMLPSKLIFKDRMAQQPTLYKMFKSEKWVTYALLAFVLFLASFNVTGSLSMLVVEKKADIFTLKSLGASSGYIRSIFLSEGMLIALTGGIAGLFVGSILVIGQDLFGIIKMSGAIVESYPVKLLWSDILIIFGTNFILGFVTSLYPAWKSVSKR